MATLLVPENYATISAAITAASGGGGGDTISIAAGTYNESISLTNASDVAIVEGRSGNRADVTITNNSTVVNIGDGTILRHVTIEDTRVGYPGTSAGNYAVSGATGGGILRNCHIKTGSGGYASSVSGGVLDRCHIESTEKNSVNKTVGVITTSSAVINIYSSLVEDFNWTSIYMYGKGNVINCTTFSSYKTSPAYRGIYAQNVYNCVAWNDTNTASLYSGIDADVVKNCISYGWGNDPYLGTTSLTASYTDYDPPPAGSSAVAVPIFVDMGADDFNINNTGSAYQNGTYEWQTANSVALTDLSGNPFDTSNPAIGCYEYVTSGGTITNSVIKSMGGGLLGSPFTLTP